MVRGDAAHDVSDLALQGLRTGAVARPSGSFKDQMVHDNPVKPLRLAQPQMGSQSTLKGPGTPTAGPAPPKGCWIDRGPG